MVLDEPNRDHMQECTFRGTVRRLYASALVRGSKRAYVALVMAAGSGDGGHAPRIDTARMTDEGSSEQTPREPSRL
jgi:hypothetical protein